MYIVHTNRRMKPFAFRIDKETFERAQELSAKWGIASISGFIRFAIAKFPYSDMERKWTDADMKAFAQRWATRPGNPPSVLEDPAIQMEREFARYKKDFLKSKQ